MNNEKCVLCNKELDIRKNQNISKRNCYVEGIGQLCVSCFRVLNGQLYVKK